jgi:AraC family transcriptional regulator
MTKPSQQLSYERRVDRVADYIHDHLDEDVSLDRLAEIACLSAYHWHRIYTAMRGETIAATVKRLRLLRAADRLANSDMPIKTIAERAGYGAIESFGRAFKEAYDKPPADYRAHGSHAAFRTAIAVNDAAGFSVTIEDLPQTRCASIAHVGPYIQIDRAIGRLFGALAAQGLLDQSVRMIGLFLDDPDATPAAALRSKACSPTPAEVALARPIEETILRGGPYARLRYKGPYADMKSAYRWLLGVWLPNSGYEAADAPIFDAYLNSPPETPPNDLVTDIHLPLEAAS